jgi:hypothetical protein
MGSVKRQHEVQTPISVTLDFDPKTHQDLEAQAAQDGLDLGTWAVRAVKGALRHRQPRSVLGSRLAAWVAQRGGEVRLRDLSRAFNLKRQELEPELEKVGHGIYLMAADGSTPGADRRNSSWVRQVPVEGDAVEEAVAPWVRRAMAAGGVDPISGFRMEVAVPVVAAVPMVPTATTPRRRRA